MREKYKRRIRKFAEQSLEKKLEQNITPYMDYIPSEIQDAIKNEVMNVSFPDEESLGPTGRLGSKLQSEGRVIADKIVDKILKQTIPFIEKEIKNRKAKLAKELDLTDKFSVFPVFKSKFRDFSNKNEFYRELAEVANKIINSNKGYNEKDILASILSKSESCRRELLSGLINYFDREKTLLYEFENWGFKKTEIGCA